MANTPEDCGAIHLGLDRLENSVERNLIRSNKAKCRILSPEYLHRLGADLLKSSCEEKHLAVLVDDQLTTSWQCLLAKRANVMLG